MYTQTRKSLLASSIALAMAAIGGPVAAETLSQDITNARQETQIWTTYALNPYLRANELKVSVHNGTATLTGNVEEGVNKDLAREIAMGVSGINKVDNQIVVQNDYVPPAKSSERSYGDVIDDASITAAVKSKLMWSRYTDGLTTEVTTKAGRVTLAGTADSGAAKELARRLAMNTRGVRSVDNQLVVAGAKVSATKDITISTDKTERVIADSWITTKVKSTFMYSEYVDSSEIMVNTKNGIVTLSGNVDSGVERALAIELAENVRGVKSVQSAGLTH